MKPRIIVLVVLFLGLLVSAVFASWNKKPQIRWMQLYRHDLRDEDQELYANRLSATFSYWDKKEKPLLKLMPFFEFRRNVAEGFWERKEAGIEIGKDIFPWFYLGEGIQAVWLREAYRQFPPGKSRDSTEAETRLVFSQNLFSHKGISVKGYLLGEYTYDFDRGEATRNEVTMGLITPIGKYLETSLSWRHVDRIHDFDSDALEISATFIF